MGRPHTVEPRFLETVHAGLEALAVEGVEGGARVLESIAFVPAEVLKRPTLDISKRARIFLRDRFICRYCGLRTVPEPIFELLGIVYPKLIPFTETGKVGRSIQWSHS